MKLANEKPDSITLVSLLGAFTRILNIRLARTIMIYGFGDHGHGEEVVSLFAGMEESALKFGQLIILRNLICL
ncbi:hypothetical protein H5410_002068 [Solanum commersonii]|uniref:Uncharacterized protein n=1 Tax=Solanum commersonii TaxID=4109 RepID=A0A9J6B1U8_SOLCO|nr:hypothetical protein H5410_002068 [Solanum commersonii]